MIDSIRKELTEEVLSIFDKTGHKVFLSVEIYNFVRVVIKEGYEIDSARFAIFDIDEEVVKSFDLAEDKTAFCTELHDRQKYLNVSGTYAYVNAGLLEKKGSIKEQYFYKRLQYKIDCMSDVLSAKGRVEQANNTVQNYLDRDCAFKVFMSGYSFEIYNLAKETGCSIAEIELKVNAILLRDFEGIKIFLENRIATLDKYKNNESV